MKEKEFLKFILRMMSISVCGFVLIIPIVNIIFLDYIWNSKEDKNTLIKLFFDFKNIS